MDIRGTVSGFVDSWRAEHSAGLPLCLFLRNAGNVAGFPHCFLIF
jgi:hypothetical protein